MANELNLSVSLNFSNGGALLSRGLQTAVSITGNVCHQSVQVVGNAEEAVTFPSDMGSVGFVVLHNLDDTNAIYVGRTTSVYTMKISPGNFCLFELHSGTEFFVVTSADTCDMEKILIEV